MDIEKMRMFATLAECLNFTKAAEKLYVSQPTLSRNISELEKNLGAALLIRDTHTVQLTEAGKFFYSECKQIINEYEIATSRIKNLDKGATGLLRIGCHSPFVKDFLPTACGRYRKKHPDVYVQLFEMSSQEAYASLSSGLIDIGFMLLQAENIGQINSCFASIPLREGTLKLITGKAHEWADRDSIPPALLRGQTILSFGHTMSEPLRREVTKLCLAEGFAPHFSLGKFSPDSLLLMVRCGAGICILTSLNQNIYYPGQQLHIMDIDGCHFKEHLHMVWKKDNKNPCLTNFVKETAHAALSGNAAP